MLVLNHLIEKLALHAPGERAVRVIGQHFFLQMLKQALRAECFKPSADFLQLDLRSARLVKRSQRNVLILRAEPAVCLPVQPHHRKMQRADVELRIQLKAGCLHHRIKERPNHQRCRQQHAAQAQRKAFEASPGNQLRPFDDHQRDGHDDRLRLDQVSDAAQQSNAEPGQGFPVSPALIKPEDQHRNDQAEAVRVRNHQPGRQSRKHRIGACDHPGKRLGFCPSARDALAERA